MSQKIFVSTRFFKCAYCEERKKGAYKIVDGYKSCEQCNRMYDYKPVPVVIKCPLCKQDWEVARQ